MRRYLVVVMTLVGLLCMSGCSGRTTGATEISANSARLTAVGSCDRLCTVWFRYRPVGTAIWHETFHRSVGAARAAHYTRKVGLLAGTWFEYQGCGSGFDSGGQFYARCVGPDGRSGSSDCFHTPSAASPSAQAMPVGNMPGWRQVLADDFNGNTLSRCWGAYRGQPAGDAHSWWDPSHAVVGNGVLTLATYQDLVGQTNGAGWISGGVSSAPCVRQTYGKYLVRFRMDAGVGVGHVELLIGSDSWPPEIDFGEDGGSTGARRHVNATVHYGFNNTVQSGPLNVDFTQWHTLGVEWTPGMVVYTIDGLNWATVRGSQVPSTRQEMDLQTEVGDYGVLPNLSTPRRVDMQVDWVAEYAYAP